MYYVIQSVASCARSVLILPKFSGRLESFRVSSAHSSGLPRCLLLFNWVSRLEISRWIHAKLRGSLRASRCRCCSDPRHSSFALVGVYLLVDLRCHCAVVLIARAPSWLAHRDGHFAFESQHHEPVRLCAFYSELAERKVQAAVCASIMPGYSTAPLMGTRRRTFASVCRTRCVSLFCRLNSSPLRVCSRLQVCLSCKMYIRSFFLWNQK